MGRGGSKGLRVELSASLRGKGTGTLGGRQMMRLNGLTTMILGEMPLRMLRMVMRVTGSAMMMLLETLEGLGQGSKRQLHLR